MNTEFDFPYTYSGLLDDVMAKYGPAMASEDFFNRMIAKNLFFGGGIYINDGYLVNHPIARQHLMNENSMLRSMLRYGFIKVLTREADGDALSKMPEKMKEQGNESFRILVDSSEWKNGLRSEWYNISKWAFDNGNAPRWPKRDMSFGFCKLMSRAFDAAPEEVGVNLSESLWLSICDDFYAREPLKSGPRDKLEKAAISVLARSNLGSSAQDEALRSIMGVGNQAYHYNFGLSLTSEIGARSTETTTNGGAICVDTTIGKAFDELLLVDEIDAYMLEKIPLFGIPESYRFDDGEIFEPLVRPGSSAYLAKVNFAKSIQQAILGADGNDSVATDLEEQVSDCMNDYIAALIRELPFSIDERAFTADDGSLTVKMEGAVLSADGGAVTGGNNACISHAIAMGSKEKGMEFLVKRGVLSSSEPLNLNEVRPQISALLFDMKKATDFMEDIPTFD